MINGATVGAPLLHPLPQGTRRKACSQIRLCRENDACANGPHNTLACPQAGERTSDTLCEISSHPSGQAEGMAFSRFCPQCCAAFPQGKPSKANGHHPRTLSLSIEW